MLQCNIIQHLTENQELLASHHLQNTLFHQDNAQAPTEMYRKIISCRAQSWTLVVVSQECTNAPVKRLFLWILLILITLLLIKSVQMNLKSNFFDTHPKLRAEIYE